MVQCFLLAIIYYFLNHKIYWNNMNHYYHNTVFASRDIIWNTIFACFIKSSIISKSIHTLIGYILCITQKKCTNPNNVTCVSMATKYPIIKHWAFFKTLTATISYVTDSYETSHGDSSTTKVKVKVIKSITNTGWAITFEPEITWHQIKHTIFSCFLNSSIL